MQNDINKFTFYRNYYEIAKYLPDKDQLRLYQAIFEYVFEDKEPELKTLLKGIWTNIKMPLDTNKKNIINGKNGGRPANANKTEIKPRENPEETQNITQEEPKAEPKRKANNISYFLFLISNNNYKYIIVNTKLYNILLDWLKYKQERKEIYKETGLKNLLAQIEKQVEEYGEEKVVDVISQCMASNYRGIIFDKLKQNSNKSIREKNAEFFKKMEAEFKNE